jgi:hypothetical protein
LKFIQTGCPVKVERLLGWSLVAIGVILDILANRQLVHWLPSMELLRMPTLQHCRREAFHGGHSVAK